MQLAAFTVEPRHCQIQSLIAFTSKIKSCGSNCMIGNINSTRMTKQSAHPGFRLLCREQGGYDTLAHLGALPVGSSLKSIFLRLLQLQGRRKTKAAEAAGVQKERLSLRCNVHGQVRKPFSKAHKNGHLHCNFK